MYEIMCGRAGIIDVKQIAIVKSGVLTLCEVQVYGAELHGENTKRNPFIILGCAAKIRKDLHF